MTVVKLVSVVLELKGIQQASEEFWSCYEVLEKDDMGKISAYSGSGTNNNKRDKSLSCFFFI